MFQLYSLLNEDILPKKGVTFRKQKPEVLHCIGVFLEANFILHIINEPLFIALGLLNAFQLHS